MGNYAINAITGKFDRVGNGGGGGGTVTQVSGTANQVSVATGTTTPIISLIGPYTPTTYTARGLLVGEGINSIVALSAGNAGQIVQSGGVSANPLYSTATYPSLAGTSGNIITSNGTNFISTAPVSGSVTINGDSGSVSGSLLSILGSTGSANAGASVKFIASSATELDLNLTDTGLNTFLGKNSGNSSVSGLYNTSTGYATLSGLTSGSLNAVFGINAGKFISTGSQNTSIGYNSMSTGVVTNSYNTAIGSNSLPNLVGGGNNTSIGSDALYNLLNTSNNVAIGYQAASSLVNGSQNVIIGQNAGSAYSGSESNCIVIGATVPGTAGENNVVRIGQFATSNFQGGISGVTTSNPTMTTIDETTSQLGSVFRVISANNDTVIGSGSGNRSDSGNNTIFGYNTLANNTGSGNSAFGCSCGTGLGNGYLNNMMGIGAMSELTSGYQNQGIGAGALYDISSGNNNDGYGYHALTHVQTGSYNIGIGANAGEIYTGADSNNICIANSGVTGESNTLRLGTSGTGTQQVSKAFIAGINGNTITSPAYVGIDTTTGQLGVINAANRPSFSAYLGDSTGGVTGNATLYNVIFGQTLLNIGTGYSTTTGVFTAPVAGTYIFTSTISIGGQTASNTEIYAQFRLVTGTSFATAMRFFSLKPSLASDPINSSGSFIIPMIAGNTIKVQIYAQGGAKNVGLYAGGINTNFTGALLF